MFRKSPLFVRLAGRNPKPSVRVTLIGMGVLITGGIVGLCPTAYRIALMDPAFRPPVPVLLALIRVWLAVSVTLPLVSGWLGVWMTEQHLSDPAFPITQLIPDLTSRERVRILFAAALFRLRIPLGLYVGLIPALALVMVIENISAPYMALLNPGAYVMRGVVLYAAVLLWPVAYAVMGTALGISIDIRVRNLWQAGGLASLVQIVLPLLMVGLPWFWLAQASSFENDTPALPFFSALGGVILIYVMPFIVTPVLLHWGARRLRAMKME